MKNEKFFFAVLSFLFFLIFSARSVFAQSTYVLPYPSSMPGSLAYKIHVVYENFSRYWYFGDFGQFDYSLKMADKYLVEAKTLFDYKQYLLAYNALKKSDQYFLKIYPNLIKAEKNGKNISQKKTILDSAAQKHIEIIRELDVDIPSVFVWKPEKMPATTLNLREALNVSIQLRDKNQ